MLKIRESSSNWSSSHVRERLYMVATGQEMIGGGGGGILQGQGNVRKFYPGSGKIGILKKKQGKLKL